MGVPLLDIEPRPSRLEGFTEKVRVGCGTLYITVNGNSPKEVFMALGHSGGCNQSQLEGISRLISLNLTRGVSLLEICEQLKNIRCPTPTVSSEGIIALSCPDAVARVLEGRVLSSVVSTPKEVTLGGVTTGGLCPDCNTSLLFQEGCTSCPACGYSKC